MVRVSFEELRARVERILLKLGLGQRSALAAQLIAETDLLLRTTLYDGDSIAVREALQLAGAPSHVRRKRKQQAFSIVSSAKTDRREQTC